MLGQKVKIVRTDYTGKVVVSREDASLIAHDILVECRKLFKTIKTQEAIPPNTNVYFSGTAVFPRRKFSKMFTENKLTPLEKAEVVVMDMKDTAKRLEGAYSAYYLKHTDGSFEHTYRVPDPNGNVLYRFIDGGPTTEKLLNEIDSLQRKIVVDLKDVCLPSTEKLDREGYDRIMKMLNATDIGMRNVALRLLSAYNYDEEKEKISLLLGVNWLSASAAKMDSVEIKSMLRKLDMDFSDWRYLYYKPLSHWIKQCYAHPEDELFLEIMNNALRKEWPGAPKIKIAKDE